MLDVGSLTLLPPRNFLMRGTIFSPISIARKRAKHNTDFCSIVGVNLPCLKDLCTNEIKGKL